ncbi:glycoside hydrolase family 79 protein [Scleroderma yunnanense]
MVPSRRSFILLCCAAFSRRQLPSFCLLSLVLFNLFFDAYALSLSPVEVTLPQNAHSATSAVVVQDNFLGISFELNSFDTLWGKSPQQMPIPMQNYLSNLRARMHSPLRIRIGGNSMDSSTYVSNQTQMIILTDPNAYFNNVPVDFGPTFFDVLNAMADVVGEMEFMITLSMQDPQNDTDVIELAKAGRDMLGSRLDSMLLGNEPDLYAGHGTRANYTIQDYIPEIGQVLGDLRNSQYGNLIPETIIGGPTICCSWNLSDVLDAGLTQYPYKYYTLQHYPTHTCQGPNAKNTNITYFVSHTNVPVFAQWQSDGIQMARDANVPVLMTEYNSVSCGGSNISDTFAAALWAVDVALEFASHGISAAYLHTREWQVLYNLFDPPTPDNSTQPGWRTGSPYYSALFLSETFPHSGVVALDLNLDNSIYDAAVTVAGHALYGQNGTVCERLVLINFGDDAGTPRNFSLPPNLAHSVGVRLLTAPSIAETTQIAWAGQTVGRNGELEGVQSTQYYTGCANGCNINVPGPGAALVLLGDTEGNSSFYVGNSSVAGVVGYQDGSTGTPVGSTSSSLSSKSFGGHEALLWATAGMIMLGALHR